MMKKIKHSYKVSNTLSWIGFIALIIGISILLLTYVFLDETMKQDYFRRFVPLISVCFILVGISVILAHRKERDRIVKLKQEAEQKEEKIKALADNLRHKQNDEEVLLEEKKQEEERISELQKSNEKLEVENRSAYKRLYESQLSGELHLMFALKNSDDLFDVKNFQGSWDKGLTDIIGMTKGTFWMIELKKEKEDVVAEKGKEAREKQFNQLQKGENLSLKTIADQCHWLGYGTNKSTGNPILFTTYWTAFETKNLEKVTFKQFIDRAYSDSDSIGVSHGRFTPYVRFLVKCYGGNDETAKEIPFLLFCKDKNGATFTVKTDLHSCEIAIKEQMEQELKKEQDLKIKRQQNKNRKTGEISSP